MMAKALASCLGIGAVPKGSGTLASLLMVFIWLGMRSPVTFAVLVAITIPIGIWAASRVESEWGKDSANVVVDELSGMGIGLLFVPVSIKFGAMAFVTFRLFDIFKPFGIRRLESLSGGWGVMADDVAAGVATLIVMQLICAFF